MNQFRKPHPDALPSVFGWFLPKTGELLVSIRGLENPVEGYIPNRPYSANVVQVNIEPVVDIEQPVVEPEILEVTTTPVLESPDAALNFLAENNLVTMPTSDVAIEQAKVISSKQRTKK